MRDMEESEEASGARVSVCIRESNFLSKTEESHESRDGEVACYIILFPFCRGRRQGERSKLWRWLTPMAKDSQLMHVHQ